MADSAVSQAEYDALVRRVNELNAKLDAVNAATARSKRLSLVMTILIAGSAVLGVWLLLSPFIQIYNNPEPYKAELKTAANEELFPALRDEFKAIMEKSAPALKDVAINAYKENEEKLAGALDSESKILVANITKFGQEQYDARRTRIEHNVMTKLQEVAPELKSDKDTELIMKNLQRATDDAVTMALDKHFSNHIKSVVSIQESLQAFPVPDTVSSMSDAELREELTTSVMGYVQRILLPQVSEETRGFLNGANVPAAAATTPAVQNQ